MEKIKGKFFLPADYKRKKKQINGTLEIESNGSANLDLSGVLLLDENEPFPLFITRQNVNIWGIVENGSKVSLLDCLSIKATQHLDEDGMSLETFRVSFVLKRAWVKDIHSNYFNKLSAKIEGLDLWLNIYGGKESISFDGNKMETFSYTYTNQTP